MTILWENTRMYMAIYRNRARIMRFALYVLPPAAVASSESKHAETPWGREVSDAARNAVAQELQEAIEQFQGPGYNGIPSAGLFLDSCQTVVFVGLEVMVGLYFKEEGMWSSARGPAVEDGYGLADAPDPSNYRLPLRP